jgi:hypothetical protein
MTKARLATVEMESKGVIITYKSSFNWLKSGQSTEQFGLHD